jgi:HlyD family secretion protein
MGALEIAQTQMDEAKATISIVEAEIQTTGTERRMKLAKLAHARAVLNTAKANVKARQVAVDKARTQASFTQLTAAFDGVVTRRTADPGNFVQASDSRLLTPLLTLQRVDQVRVVVQLPSEYAALVERDNPVDLTIESLAGAAITGQKIARFSSAIDPKDRTMTVEIDVLNPDGRLMPGMFGNVTIHFKKRFADAFVVPSSCLILFGQPSGPGYMVYIIRDGKAHQLIVEVSMNNGKEAEISKGIKASDLIITNNQGKLREGTPVKVEKGP